MARRTLGALGLALFLMPALVAAQALPQASGAATPGPAAPRPQIPPRDGALGAVPTGTSGIRGRVMAADTNTPLRRAQVRITNAQPGMAMQQTANTDADGRYEFAKLPASRYTITVSRNGYVTLQFGQQRPFEPGRPLNLADGEVAEKIDFALPRGGVITGRITDNLGEPVAGVRVDAQRYQYLPGGQRRLTSPNNPGIPFGFVTDDLGQFRMYGLMPGAYVVSAAPQPFGAAAMTGGIGTASSGGDDGFTATYFPGTANPEEAQTVTVGVGQEANATFAVVSSRMSRVSGVVRNSQGSPVARASISLVTRSGTGMSAMGGTTQEDGSFSFSNVAPGDHSIDVRPMGPGAVVMNGTPQGSDEFGSAPFTAAGQDITGLIITTGVGATIAGTVVFEGAGQTPQMDGRSLRVSPTAADPSTPIALGAPLDSGVVDESGHFQIRGANGRILFRTVGVGGPALPGWFLKSVTLNGIDITDTPFEAKPSTNTTGLEVTMTDKQTSVAGAVKNARGDTLKDFVVVILPNVAKEGAAAARFTRAVRPDQQGRYEAKGLPAGDYVAVAIESLEQGGEWDPAFQQQMKPRGKTFRLADGQSTTLDLSLTP